MVTFIQCGFPRKAIYDTMLNMVFVIIDMLLQVTLHIEYRFYFNTLLLSFRLLRVNKKLKAH